MGGIPLQVDRVADGGSVRQESLGQPSSYQQRVSPDDIHSERRVTDRTTACSTSGSGVLRDSGTGTTSGAT